MDLSVLLGLIGAITSISVGVILEGGNPAGVLHISSFIIVIPTAMLAAVVATDSKYVKAAFKEFKNIFKKSPVNFEARIDELVEYVQGISPVPGGVGPMTVAMVVENTWTAYE